MRFESFMRHVAIVAVAGMLAVSAGAEPARKPTRLGKLDEVARIPPTDCDGPGSEADAGRETGENADGGGLQQDEKKDDASGGRESKRVKASVRQQVRLGLARDSIGRTRSRARDAGRRISTLRLTRTLLRRR